MEETYYEKNKKDILKKRKDFYEKNKDELNAKSLLYYYNNRDRWKEYSKKYSENKELDHEIKDLKEKQWAKQSYLNRLQRLKSQQNKVTIDQNAVLIIKWNE